MSKRLISALQSLDLDLTAEEIADIVWLALQMRAAPSTPTSVDTPADHTQFVDQPLKQKSQGDPSRQLTTPSAKRDPQPKPSVDSADGHLYAKTEDSTGLLFRTPKARFLPHSLSLARALRPLRQQVTSPARYQLDEPATIEWIAETHVWLPILRGVPERYFDVVLLVENSGSMEIWPPVIAEFRQLLENHGTFRNVYTWDMNYRENTIHLSPKTGGGPVRMGNRRELLDPTRRRVILVVSDCISAAWYDGEMIQLLQFLGQHHPVAILQMLPQRLWRGTGLSQGLRINLRATAANMANRQLSDDAQESWLAEDIPQGIKMPIITLEADTLGYWANLVRGKSDSWVQGVIFKPPLLGKEETENEEMESHSHADIESHSRESGNPSSEVLSAEQRVQRFRALASPLAQQLASYLAEMPLTLEIMRLVQRNLLPQSGQVHLAEVFLGGLLKREGAGWFEFHDGVRELLAVSGSIPQEVLKKVSVFIEQRLGAARDFLAQLRYSPQAEGYRHFATVGARVLKRFGEEYAKLVELAMQVTTPRPPPLQGEGVISPSPSQEDQRVVSPPPLQGGGQGVVGQPFDFETVTVNSRGEIIRREHKQAYQIVEELGNGVMLEMVYIPGGTFLMGAPADEKGSYDDERPQHRVTIQPFYLGRYPVTQAQWRAIMGNNPSYFKGDDRPVETVRWEEAVEFCQKLSQRTGKTYQLPSEAQWEYACRAGTTTPFSCGETLTTDLANYDGNSTYAQESKGKYRQETTPVGSFPPNAFGLYDMHGNVWEWCQDVWHGNYAGAPTDGSAWAIDGEQNWHVLRGGSWINYAHYCRSANRSWFNDQGNNYGFRVVVLR